MDSVNQVGPLDKHLRNVVAACTTATSRHKKSTHRNEKNRNRSELEYHKLHVLEEVHASQQLLSLSLCLNRGSLKLCVVAKAL